MKKTRRLVSLVLCLFLAIALCQPVLQLAVPAKAAVMTRKPLTQGQENIVKRAYQMVNIRWTPVKDILGWRKGITYKAGTTYTGLPYGQPVYASYVPWTTSLNGFLEAVGNPNSKMYTDDGTYNGAYAPYYSVDCSGFVSWALDLPRRQPSSSIGAYGIEISRSSYANAEVADFLCDAGNHVSLITDVTYDASGNVNSIEISEAGSTKYGCHSVRYGEGGSRTLERFYNYYFVKNDYILYRSKTRDSATYTHSCAVPLPDDECYLCGHGIITENPINVSVLTNAEVVFYIAPSTQAEQVGALFAGVEIEVASYFDDKDGVRWYKTWDEYWFQAANTTPQCDHNYSCVATSPPTCVDDGSATYLCPNCAHSYTQVISATGHSFTDGFCTVCEEMDPDAAVAQVGGVQYVSFADAYANGEGHIIQLLADVGQDTPVELVMDKDMTLDLNGFCLSANVTANDHIIYGLDTTTADYQAEQWGLLQAAGANVVGADGYLAVAEGDRWAFHAYALELVAVSLDPVNDALGYKACFYGDPVVCGMVESFGFHMGVQLQKTYTVDKNLTNGQTYTLRLKNIMACNGGEMAITASAFVSFRNGASFATAQHSTTMKDTVLDVNDNWMVLTSAQKTAVQALYAKYQAAMEPWFADRVNNLA